MIISHCPPDVLCHIKSLQKLLRRSVISYHEVDALARILRPKIQALFESEGGQWKFVKWKAKHEKDKDANSTK